MRAKTTMAFQLAAMLVGGVLAMPAMAQTSKTAPAPVPSVSPPTNASPGASAAPTNGLSVTTPAPVPHAIPEQVSPANRVAGAGPGGQARASGPASGAPFSSTPLLGTPGGGLNGPHAREAPASSAVTTPNMSR